MRLRGLWQRTSGTLYPALTVLLLLILWQSIVTFAHIPAYILPAPTNIIVNTIDQFPILLHHGLLTLQEIIIGFLISVIIGIALAVAIVSSRLFEQSVYPLLVASQTIPKVALAPLFLIWLGFGLAPKVLIVFLIAFFPIVISTVVGLRSVPSELIDLGRSMGAPSYRLFARVRFPYALPSTFAGLKVGITLAVVGAIYGEFVGSDGGLGYLLLVASGRTDTPLVFSVILVLVLVGVLLFLFVDFLERTLIPWHPATTRGARTRAE